MRSGLSGELRAVSQINTRIREAAKLGFRRVVVPRTYRQEESLPDQVSIIPIRSLSDALNTALPRAQ